VPAGRTVNFALKTADVIHSFWIPALSGKRDVMPNHTNFIWFTPDTALGAQVWNGHCAEYCGASHANMKFRAYTVTPEQFDSWVRGQQQVAAFGATAPAAPAPAPAAPGATQPATAADSAAISPPAQPPAAPVTTAGYVFPVEQMPAHTKTYTPTPAGLTIDTNLRGDPARGQQAFVACIGCHAIAGNPMAMGQVGPNLTHVGSRHTLGAGLFPNDTRHLALWIKNARAMKPGVLMPTLGLGQMDPVTKAPVTKALGGLTDQQIMDIVAYLQALK